MQSWDADLYLKFSRERTQPALDLIAHVAVSKPGRIVDLGCGPGNSTEVLRRRWPEAEIEGVDKSSEMIRAAKSSYPDGKWVLADIAGWTAETPYDILFSNAALQWLPDHATLFPHLFSQIAPGGAFAVQMPAHFSSSLHREITRVADDPEWREVMVGPRNALTRESPHFYYDVLQPLASRLKIWVTEYYHVMESPEAIVEWFRGTGLMPYLSALETDEQRLRFEDMLKERYRMSYPRQNDSRVLFPFRRLFIVAYHP